MRAVAVLARSTDAAACPPGVEPTSFAAALLEDVCEVVASLASVQPAVIVSPADWLPVAALPVWPGTLVLGVSGDDGAVLAGFDALAQAGAAYAVIVAGDAPDLPGLLVGKLFRALGTADATVCPAVTGGLVALGARLPVAPWLRAAGPSLDGDSALDHLAAAAPRRGSLRSGPGWHRLRTSADLGYLDPGLEGWDATRALLGR